MLFYVVLCCFMLFYVVLFAKNDMFVFITCVFFHFWSDSRTCSRIVGTVKKNGDVGFCLGVFNLSRSSMANLNSWKSTGYTMP